MNVALLLKIVGVGLLVAFSCQILSKTGRDEMSVLVSVSGIIIIIALLIGELSGLIKNLRDIFGI